ncbi:MAG: dihydroneopterin aldolase [Alphaproteobacteria bacterium]|nr:dihydroneopterin aldolase [Alphaproteobacteria bacterium]
MYKQLNITGYKTYVILGNNPEERAEKRPITINVSLRFLQDNMACNSDDLSNTICYSSLLNFLEKKLENASFKLIEKAAQFIYDSITEYLNDNLHGSNNSLNCYNGCYNDADSGKNNIDSYSNNIDNRYDNTDNRYNSADSSSNSRNNDNDNNIRNNVNSINNINNGIQNYIQKKIECIKPNPPVQNLREASFIISDW